MRQKKNSIGLNTKSNHKINFLMKRKTSPSHQPAGKKIKFENLPPCSNLDDLINIGKTMKFYKNLDVVVLWDILPYLIDLQNMIGMKKVKESIFYQTIYYLQNMHKRNIDGDYLHTIITGKPGTGKTTVAKIIGKIYQHIGVLSHNGKFRIAHREDMVGEFLGSTANKTKKLLTSCIGGVLFVDEVYALGPGQKDKDSYSKEAIDTICAFLSENKTNFCFIAAGYKDQIEKCFFSVNEGLRRRFQWIHHIEDYTPEDLCLIFLKMIYEMKWETKLENKVITEIIKENKDLFKDAGGSMENLFSKIKLVHSKRVFGLTMEHKFIIVEEDVKGAIEMMKLNEMTAVKREYVYDYYT
jgi:Holliday junction resolvasome RuvABC ATP-dependent DNA helicase subunit